MNIVVCQDQVQTFLCWMGSKAMKAKMTEACTSDINAQRKGNSHPFLISSQVFSRSLFGLADLLKRLYVFR